MNGILGNKYCLMECPPDPSQTYFDLRPGDWTMPSSPLSWRSQCVPSFLKSRTESLPAFIARIMNMLTFRPFVSYITYSMTANISALDFTESKKIKASLNSRPGKLSNGWMGMNCADNDWSRIQASQPHNLTSQASCF